MPYHALTLIWQLVLNSVSLLTVERENYGYDQGEVPAVGRHALVVRSRKVIINSRVRALVRAIAFIAILVQKK